MPPAPPSDVLRAQQEAVATLNYEMQCGWGSQGQAGSAGSVQTSMGGQGWGVMGQGHVAQAAISQRDVSSPAMSQVAMFGGPTSQDGAGQVDMGQGHMSGGTWGLRQDDQGHGSNPQAKRLRQ